MKKKFFGILIFFCFFILIIFFWQGIYLPKSSQSSQEKLFSFKKGENLFQVAENLQKEDLIKNKIFFEIYVISKGKIRNLQAGDYLFNASMSISKIANIIISGKVVKEEITIPEGFTMQQIQERLNSLPNVTKSFLVTLKVGDLKREFQFLEGAPNNATLEGFLFPDTYYFYPHQRGDEVVRIFLRNFEEKLTPDLREEIKKQEKTIFEIVIIASLLEKEVRTSEDKKLVSGILWKRLKTGMPLQVDATISYITGRKTTKISIKELQTDSPYNTYKYLGLPKGPISNPGLDSISAAVYPEISDYWYYLSTPEGKTIFSKTLKEHNIARAKELK